MAPNFAEEKRWHLEKSARRAREEARHSMFILAAQYHAAHFFLLQRAVQALRASFATNNNALEVRWNWSIVAGLQRVRGYFNFIYCRDSVLVCDEHRLKMVSLCYNKLSMSRPI
jgi:hypothetical protein